MSLLTRRIGFVNCAEEKDARTEKAALPMWSVEPLATMSKAVSSAVAPSWLADEAVSSHRRGGFMSCLNLASPDLGCMSAAQALTTILRSTYTHKSALDESILTSR